jgi:hypothetical protein
MLNLATHQTFCLVLAGALRSGPTPAEIGHDVARKSDGKASCPTLHPTCFGFDAVWPLLASNRLHA